MEKVRTFIVMLIFMCITKQQCKVQWILVDQVFCFVLISHNMLNLK